MKKAILFLFITSTFLLAGNGGRAGAFLRIGLGSHYQSLGNAGVAALNPGTASMYYNPALLAIMEKRTAELSYSDMSLDREFIYAGFTTPLKGNAALGFLYIKSGVGNIDARNFSGEVYGAIEHSYHVGQISFANKVGPVQFGISFKILYELMDNPEFNYEGTGFGLDVGLLYQYDKDLAFGLQIKDVNAKLESNSNEIYTQGQTTENAFPVIYKLGTQWRVLPEYGSVYYDFETSSASAIKHHFGVESVPFFDYIQVRLGLENERFTGGFGLLLPVFSYQTALSYAFLPSVVDEGANHVFTWNFVF
jgi:hypothetical protein